MRPGRSLAALLLALATLGLLAGPAAAHPLGNFTTNTADRVVLADRAVEVVHLVDSAELPTVQLTGRWDADGDDRLSGDELAAYATSACAEDAGLLGLTVGGQSVPLAVTSSSAEALPGQGGLPTTLLTCRLDADVEPRGEVVFTDDASAGRTGWREVTAVAQCGSLQGSDVPAVSTSALLTSYPEDQLGSPLDVRSATFTAEPGPCTGSTETELAERTALPRGLGGLASSVTDFLGKDEPLTLPFALLSALVALAFGAVHALAPGHGKTVLAAYLVGQRGTRRQALQLGAVVTFTHTASVLLLGAVLALGALASPERVVPVTEVLSGVLLAAVGVYLLVLAVRRRRGGGLDHGHDHDHGHGDHGHGDHGARHGDHAHGDHAHGDHAHGDHAHAGHAHGNHADGHEHEHHGHAGHGHLGHDHGDHGDHGHDGHGHGHGDGGHEEHDRAHGDQDHEPGRDGLRRPVVVGGREPEVERAPTTSGGAVAVTARPRVHSHGGRSHSHEVPSGPLTWRSLAAMGVAGGLVPSPSALVVLLGATYLGRAWFGVALVVLYGLGMAATLTVAGLLLLRAQAALDKRGWAFGRGSRLGRLLPLLTAGVVVVVGVGLVVRGLLSSASLG